MAWTPALIAGVVMTALGAIGVIGGVAFFFWMRRLRGRVLVEALDRETGNSVMGSAKRKDGKWQFKKSGYQHNALKLDMNETWTYEAWYGERPMVKIDANTGRQIPKSEHFLDDDLEAVVGKYHDMFCSWVDAEAVRQHAEAQKDPWAKALPMIAIASVAIVAMVILGKIIETAVA